MAYGPFQSVCLLNRFNPYHGALYTLMHMPPSPPPPPTHKEFNDRHNMMTSLHDVFSYGNFIIMTITHKLVAYPCHSKSICGRGGTGSKGILFIGDRYTVFEVVSGDEKKFLLGMVKLCLNDDASKRNITSNTLLPQLKEVENTVLKSSR